MEFTVRLGGLGALARCNVARPAHAHLDLDGWMSVHLCTAPSCTSKWKREDWTDQPSCTLHGRCRSMKFRPSDFMHQLLLPWLSPRALQQQQQRNAAEGGVAMDAAQIDQTNSGGGGAPSRELT